jgi:hypothetical protein
LVPSLTVIVPLARIPSVKSDVLVLSGTVPVPLAGVVIVGDELELVDEPVLLDEDVLLVEEPVLLEPPLSEFNASCTAEVSWELVRLRAVWLAMLARPADKVVEAPNRLLMTVLLSCCCWLLCAALFQ